MKILITGGAGFIGSTVASASIDAGHVPVILDDLSAGAEAFAAGRIFHRGDVADGALLDEIFSVHPDIAAVVHCAAHIVVPESVVDPLQYYRNNVCKTIELVAHLHRLGARRLLFSSSASIYAPGVDFAVDESSMIEPQSPYARTKAIVEQILADAAAAGVIRALSLRYFNPIGADPRLRSGQQRREPTHAMGRLLSSYEQRRPFTVTGTSWPTRDGSGIRDYIHVWDLARAHVAAVERFDRVVTEPSGFQAINVGTGLGTTVRELVRAFEEATGSQLDVRDGPRRPGDVVGAYARVHKAASVLEWRSELSIVDAVRDAMAWSRIKDEVLDEHPGG